MTRLYVPVSVLALCLSVLCCIGIPSFAAGDEQTCSGHSPSSSAILFYQRYLSDLRYGHCRFAPSCSEYARQSIEANGLLPGIALGADRLIRCNTSARAFYAKDASGRLVDPVVGEAPLQVMPRVPVVFLPFFEELSALSLPPIGSGPALQRARECASFGDFLATHGDCERAATEYLRAAFVSMAGASSNEDSSGPADSSIPAGSSRKLYDRYREGDLIAWGHMKTAVCQYRNEQWAAAATEFLSVFRGEAATKKDRRMAGVMAAASLFNAGQYDRCRKHIKELHAAPPTDVGLGEYFTENLLSKRDSSEIECASGVVSALCDMACGRWEDASRTIEVIAEPTADSGSASRDGIAVLSSMARDGSGLPRKNGTLASALSAVVPGSGQIYGGRVGDGIRHFVLNGLLIYGVSKLAHDGEYWGSYLVAGVALPFYAGNIIGAGAAAQDFNRRTIARFLARELERIDNPNGD